jgi:hypothetical protein
MLCRNIRTGMRCVFLRWDDDTKREVSYMIYVVVVYSLVACDECFFWCRRHARIVIAEHMQDCQWSGNPWRYPVAGKLGLVDTTGNGRASWLLWWKDVTEELKEMSEKESSSRPLCLVDCIEVQVVVQEEMLGCKAQCYCVHNLCWTSWGSQKNCSLA